MALKELDQAISDRIARHRYSLGTDICRTTIFCLTDSLRILQDKFKTQFPQDPRLEPVFPWVNGRENIGSSLERAFSVRTSQSLIQEGFRIIDSINQFIFLGDLTDPDFGPAFDGAYREFRKITESIESEQASSHTIGVFLLRNVASAEGAPAVPPVQTLEALKQAQSLLDKVIALDTVNPRGALIDKPEDLQCLIAHCLHWIIEMPAQYLGEGNLQGYSEWLRRRDASSPLIAGFSGRTLVLPMEWILKTIAVAKGCEVLRSVLLEPDEAGPDAGPISFINEVSLNSLDVLRSHLVGNPEYSFPDPLKAMPEWGLSSALEFLRKMDALDASLPECARDYRDTFNKVAEKLRVQFQLRLDEYLAEIISGTKGGMVKAGAHLEHIGKHLTQLLSQIPPAAAYDDPVRIRLKIQGQLEKGPAKSALAIRTILLALIVFLGLGVFNSGIIKDVLLRSLASGAVLLLGFVTWHAWKTRLVRRVVELQDRVRRKWHVLLNNEILTIQRETIDNLHKQVEEARREVIEAERKAENLVNSFSTEYLPDRPEENTFWLNISVKKGEIFEDYVKRTKIDVLEIAKQFQREETILESWRRMGHPKEQGFNEWEWSLLERASLRILPLLEDVAAISVCQGVRNHPDMRSQFTRALKSYADPFIRTKPGSPSITVRPSIESPQGCVDIVSEMKGLLHESVGEVRLAHTHCRYRLSYMGYADDIAMESIRLG